MGLIKTLAVVGGGAYALNELSKNKTSNRSANVAVKSTIDPLAVKEAIAKDPNLLALVRGEVGPQGPQGPQGTTALPNGLVKGSNSFLNVQTDSTLVVTTGVNLINGKRVIREVENDGSKETLYYYDGTGYTPLMKIDCVTGSIAKIGGGSFSALSDERVKQDIQEFTKGLESVLDIEVKTFKYKKVSGTQTEFYPNSLCNKIQYGVIAQQLKDVCPEMVAEDENGFYSVDLSNLPLMLVNAVKELSTKLDTVTTNYEALLQRVEAIENPPATA